MGTRVPQLNTCCCGCAALRTGTLFLLWLYLIIGLLWMCSPRISGDYKTNSMTYIVGNSTQTDYQQASFVYSDDTFISHINYPKDFGIHAVFIGALSVLIAAFGLYGTYQNFHEYLKPYLVWQPIQIIITLVYAILNLFLHRIALTAFLDVAISVYFWLVIFSHYKVLRAASTHSIV